MSWSRDSRSHRSAAWALVAWLGLLTPGGCGHPNEGTVQVAPESRHLRTDTATKVRPGVDPSKLKEPPAPAGTGPLGRARGRGSL
jgi:hypothetical protein